jgi:DNA-binding helix-hairpin-helix protein with protein kinase domain
MQQVPHATVHSDAFSLATIIFMMLFQYRHPFDGIPVDHMHSGPIRSYWAEGIWPYDATQRICKPPPETNEVYQILPQTIQHLFVRAFTGVPDQRPLPSEWVDVLNEMRVQ